MSSAAPDTILIVPLAPVVSEPVASIDSTKTNEVEPEILVEIYITEPNAPGITEQDHLAMKHLNILIHLWKSTPDLATIEEKLNETIELIHTNLAPRPPPVSSYLTEEETNDIFIACFHAVKITWKVFCQSVGLRFGVPAQIFWDLVMACSDSDWMVPGFRWMAISQLFKYDVTLLEKLLDQNLLTPEKFELALPIINDNNGSAWTLVDMIQEIGDIPLELRTSRPDWSKLLVKIIQTTDTKTGGPRDPYGRLHYVCLQELGDHLKGNAGGATAEAVNDANLLPSLWKIISNYQQWTYEEMNEITPPILLAMGIIPMIIYDDVVVVDRKLHSSMEMLIDTPGALDSIEGHILRWLDGYDQDHPSPDAGPTQGEQLKASFRFLILYQLKTYLYGCTRRNGTIVPTPEWFNQRKEQIERIQSMPPVPDDPERMD